MTRFFCLLCLLFITLLPARAGEAFYQPPAAALPEVLLSFDGGRVTRDDLAQAVLKTARETSRSGLPVFRQSPPENFLRYLLLDLLYTNAGTTAGAAGNYTSLAAPAAGYTPVAKVSGMYSVCGAEALSQWRELSARAGGPASLRKQLAAGNPPLSLGDLFRSLRLQALQKKTGLEQIVPWELERLYQPRWYGVEGQRTASAGGFDFTGADLAQYLLREAGDYELQFIFEQLAAERIVLAEAEKMGLNTTGLVAEEIETAVFSPLLTAKALREYQTANPGLSTVRRCRVYAVADAGGSQTRLQRLQRDLKAGIVPDGAERVFFVPAELPAEELNPEWYGLDYFYSANGEKIHPLHNPPSAWREALRHLTAGSVTPPLRTAEGYVLLYCEELIAARHSDALLALLARQRRQAERNRLVQAVTQASTTRIFWQPAARTEHLFSLP